MTFFGFTLGVGMAVLLVTAMRCQIGRKNLERDSDNMDWSLGIHTPYGKMSFSEIPLKFWFRKEPSPEQASEVHTGKA